MTLKEFEEKGYHFELTKEDMWCAAKNLPLQPKHWILICLQSTVSARFYLKYCREFINANISTQQFRSSHETEYNEANEITTKMYKHIDVLDYLDKMEYLRTFQENLEAEDLNLPLINNDIAAIVNDLF